MESEQYAELEVFPWDGDARELEHVYIPATHNIRRSPVTAVAAETCQPGGNVVRRRRYVLEPLGVWVTRGSHSSTSTRAPGRSAVGSHDYDNQGRLSPACAPGSPDSPAGAQVAPEQMLAAGASPFIASISCGSPRKHPGGCNTSFPPRTAGLPDSYPHPSFPSPSSTDPPSSQRSIYQQHLRHTLSAFGRRHSGTAVMHATLAPRQIYPDAPLSAASQTYYDGLKPFPNEPPRPFATQSHDGLVSLPDPPCGPGSHSNSGVLPSTLPQASAAPSVANSLSLHLLSIESGGTAESTEAFPSPTQVASGSWYPGDRPTSISNDTCGELSLSLPNIMECNNPPPSVGVAYYGSQAVQPECMPSTQMYGMAPPQMYGGVQVKQEMETELLQPMAPLPPEQQSQLQSQLQPPLLPRSNTPPHAAARALWRTWALGGQDEVDGMVEAGIAVDNHNMNLSLWYYASNSL